MKNFYCGWKNETLQFYCQWSGADANSTKHFSKNANSPYQSIEKSTPMGYNKMCEVKQK